MYNVEVENEEGGSLKLSASINQPHLQFIGPRVPVPLQNLTIILIAFETKPAIL